MKITTTLKGSAQVAVLLLGPMMNLQGQSTPQTIQTQPVANLKPPGIQTSPAGIRLASPAPPKLDIKRDPGNPMTVEWTGNGDLQYTTSLAPPIIWQAIAGATSPYIVPSSTPMWFARVNDGGIISVNAVGYVRINCPIGLSLIANPLDNKAPNGNTISNLFTDIAQDQNIIYKFDNGEYADPNDYAEGLGGWYHPNQTLVPGEAAFIDLHSAGSVTFVGEVLQGNVVRYFAAGIQLVSSMVPQTGRIETDLKYPAATGDMIYIFDVSSSSFQIFTRRALGDWTPGHSEPIIDAGRGFWLQAVAAGSWVRDFHLDTP